MAGSNTIQSWYQHGRGRTAHELATSNESRRGTLAQASHQNVPAHQPENVYKSNHQKQNASMSHQWTQQILRPTITSRNALAFNHLSGQAELQLFLLKEFHHYSSLMVTTSFNAPCQWNYTALSHNCVITISWPLCQALCNHSLNLTA